MRQKLAISILLASASLYFVSPVFADNHGDADMARASMLSNTCAGCHGTDGVSAGPASPTIAGLGEDTMIEAMEQFKEDERPATIMGRIAKGYSDEDFALMAKFFAQQKFVPAKQEFDAEMAKKGKDLHKKYCSKCHEEGGSKDIDGSSILAGQWKSYLQFTLADYNGGDREAGKKMAKRLKALRDEHGEEGIAAVIEYYASQQ